MAIEKIDGHLEELNGKLTQASGHYVKYSMQVLHEQMKNANVDTDIALRETNKHAKNASKKRKKNQ